MLQTFYNTPVGRWSDATIQTIPRPIKRLSVWDRTRLRLYFSQTNPAISVNDLYKKAVFGKLNSREIQELSKCQIGGHPALFLLAERVSWVGLEHLNFCDEELPFIKHSGENLAHRAAHLGNIEVLQTILQKNPEVVTFPGELARIAVYALKAGHDHVVHFLINALVFDQHTTDESLQIKEPKELFKAIKVFLELANNGLMARHGFDGFCKFFQKDGVVEKRLLQPLLAAVKGDLFLASLTNAPIEWYVTSLTLANLFTAKHQVVRLNEQLHITKGTLGELCEQSASKTETILNLLTLELQNRGEQITRLEEFLLEIKELGTLFNACIIFSKLQNIKSLLQQTIVPRLLHPLQNGLCKNDLDQLRRYRLIDVMDKLFTCIFLDQSITTFGNRDFHPLDEKLKKFITQMIAHTIERKEQFSQEELREFEHSHLKENLLAFSERELYSQLETLYNELTSTLLNKARQNILI